MNVSRLHTVTAGSANKPPIVLLHAFSICHAVFGPLMKHLSDQFCRVALNLRGHRQSRNPANFYRCRADRTDDIASTVSRPDRLLSSSMGQSCRDRSTTLLRRSTIFCHILDRFLYKSGTGQDPRKSRPAFRPTLAHRRHSEGCARHYPRSVSGLTAINSAGSGTRGSGSFMTYPMIDTSLIVEDVATDGRTLISQSDRSRNSVGGGQ